MGRFLSLWVPVGAYIGLLFTLSSREQLGAIPSHWDKVVHTGAYGALGLLALRACHGGWSRLAPGPALGAVLITAGYGVIDELRQSRVVGRHASALDWLADLLGAALAVAVIGLVAAWRRGGREGADGQ